MTVSWRHRIIRVATDDEDGIREAVVRAVTEGWIFDSHVPSESGSVDLVFRRARPGQPRIAWS